MTGNRLGVAVYLFPQKIRPGLILTPGVQDAARPRTGLSPPERHCRSRFLRTSFSPAAADPGHDHEGGPCMAVDSVRKSARKFTDRHFSVRPNLDQLKHQAKDLLRAVRQGDPAAMAELRKHHSRRIEPAEAKLADVQSALARSYGLTSWPRLVTACRMTDAIWRGDVDTVRKLVLKDPRLLHESARGVADSNWGPPMSYAANVGQDAIIAMLRELGAEDLQHAFDRACLQGQLETARRLHAMGALVVPGLVMGPCETLNADGLALLFELGAEFADAHGDRLAPVALLLQTYSRWPEGKHRCLELVAERGIALPDTAPMAMHRGRMDLLDAHLRSDSQLSSR